MSESVVVSKVRGQVKVKDCGGYEQRNPSTIELFQLAASRESVRDFDECVIHTGDRGLPASAGNKRPHLVYCADPARKKDEENRRVLSIMVPDFVFCRWREVGIDEFDACCAAIRAAGAVPATTTKLGWIGVISTHPNRQRLLDVTRARPEQCEIVSMQWHHHKAGGGGQQLPATQYLSLAQQASRWRYLIDVEGNGYSGRLKLQLHSGRPVFVQDRPWHEYFFADLKPYVHYIPVKRDLSDLLQQLDWAESHPEATATIGKAAQEFAQQHLTRDAAIQKWVTVLMQLAK